MRARPSALAVLLALAATGAQAHAISVPMNHSVRLPLAGPAQSVVVGSPSVVDVSVVDSRTVYVSGKAPGDTDVTVIDPLGRVVFRSDVSVASAAAAAVTVFRGPSVNDTKPSRTDSTCTPYCHDAAPDQPASTGAAAAFLGALRASTGGAPASGAAATGLTPPAVSPQAVSSIPSAMGLRP